MFSGGTGSVHWEQMASWIQTGIYPQHIWIKMAVDAQQAFTSLKSMMKIEE